MMYGADPSVKASPEHMRGGKFLPTETPIHIRFADVDMMGVVHNAAYLHWFEQIRFNALDKVLELDYELLRGLGLAFPLVTSSIRYLKPFRFGDQPVGYAQIEVYKKAMFGVHYKVYTGRDGVLGATGVSTHCYLDRDSKMLMWTPEIIQKHMRMSIEKYPGCTLFHDANGTGDA